ncbi:efflux RND transporter periplasmic adaptor subunit [Amycolatopsis sp. VS8301801F10]|uniref:efflux RND transporter periplasmic adaptor subunit n=1 Tax=Amycolatopsis sp. VS8301801F10 TaxID=2652442 RepID=UPI0038FD174B
MTRLRNRTWVVNGVLVVLLGGAGFGIYQAFSPSSSTAQAQTRTTPVRRANVSQTVSAAGTIASTYTGVANFTASGKVTSIDVKVGDVVSAGQKLATIDSSQASKQLQVAKANLAVAEDNLATAQAQSSTTALQAKVDQAQLDVDNAESALAATTLTAPGAGTVTAINGTVGQQTGSGSGNSSAAASSGSTGQQSSSSSSSTGFIDITDLGSLVVNTSVAEIDVSKVKTGQKATVTLNATPDQPLPATVSSIDLTPTTSSNVVSYGAKLTLSNPPSGLRPGQSASVVITVAEADGVLSVPAAAVRTSGTTSVVTVERNGQPVSRQVEVGVRGESTVEIKSGLEEGDQVVLTAASPTTSSGSGQQRTGGTGGLGGFGGGRQGGVGGLGGGGRG